MAFVDPDEGFVDPDEATKAAPQKWGEGYQKYLASVRARQSRVSIPGAEEADKAPAKSYEEFAKDREAEVKDKYKGLLEAPLSVLSSIPATFLGSLAGMTAPINPMAHTRSPTKMFEDVTEALTYAPRSDYGQDLVHKVGSVLQAFPATGSYVPHPSVGRVKPPTMKEKLGSLETAKKFVDPDVVVPKTLEPLDARLEHPLAAETRVREQNMKQPSAEDYANRDANARAVEEEIRAMADSEAAFKAEQDATESARLNEFSMKAQQDVIDDMPHGERPAQYGMTDTGGRVDENGIPIRADLSMEAQNLQDPLQRNLWGDELPGKTGDGGVPLTRALDSMPESAQRDQAISQLSGVPRSVESHVQDILNKGASRGQRGAVDPDLLSGGLTRLFHGGRKFDRWNPATVGSGEGMGVMGPGLYAGDKEHLASQYLKYAGTEARLSDMAVDTSRILETAKKFSPEMKESYDRATKALDEMGLRATQRGVKSAVAQAPRHLHDDVRKALVSSGIDGFKENLGDSFGYEYAIFNPEVIKQISDANGPVEKATNRGPDGKQRGAIDLDAFRRQREEQEFALGKRIPVGEVTEFGIEDVAPAPEMRSAPETIPMDQPQVGAPRDLSPFASDIGNVYNPTDGFRGMGRSQRGAFDFGSKAKQELIEAATKDKLFAPLPKADDIITNALSSGKDSSGSINFSAGGSLEAAKRRSPLIEGGVRVVQGLKNMAEDAVRTTVFPAEKSLRALKKQDVIDLADVFKSEMFTRTKYSMEDLAGLGLSEKQLVAYQKVRDMHEAALAAENKARAIMGQEPVTALEHYLSSRWQGDFRVALHDSTGKHVWSLAADNKWSLDKQASELLARYPDLTPGETYTVKSNKKGVSASQVYTQMLDVLGRDDPAIIKIKEWTEEQLVLEGRKTLGQEKHFEPKGNIRGFVGDRPWEPPFKNALDLFQQQISYSKNAHHWSALQEAGQELKKVFANDELALQQPKNMDYLRQYFADQLGFNENAAIKAIEDQIRDMGVSPNQIGRGIGSVKNLWVTQKLALNLGFAMSNAIQAGNILPHLADLQVKYGGNPVSALILGPLVGTAMAAGHMAQLGPKFYKMLGSMPGYDVFYAKAMKYAEDNSVVARSIYDESPIESSFSKAALAGKVAGKTITTPETLLRGITFMTYVEQLRSSGKFKNDLELFRVAEERVNISMGDYREGERALIFNKLGNLGNALNVLQTFPMNFYNQWSWAVREAGKGNVLPGLTMFGIQAYVAGAMGVPGFAEADKAVDWIKDWLATKSPEQWAKVKDFSLKRLVLDTMGEGALYGGASVHSGIALTSRAAAPIPTEMLQAPGAPWVDLAQQAGSVASLATDPMNPQKQAQAAMNIAPSGLTGLLETGPFKDQTSVPQRDQQGNLTGNSVYGKPKDLSARTGMVVRTPEEERLRALGFRSQREAVERDLSYAADKQAQNAAKVINALPGKIYNELRNNNRGQAQDLVKLYIELSGKDFDGAALEKQMIEEYTTPKPRSALRQNMPVEAALAVKRLHETLKALGHAN